MVGEEAGLGGVVHESLVDGMLNGCELDPVAAVLEDGAETVGLVYRVGEDEYAVSFGEEFGETLRDEVEVLVIEHLR